jgi:excisionase family DNA binding protein
MKKKQSAPIAIPAPGFSGDTLLKGEEVAQILGVGLVTVRRMVSRGELHSLRLNHSVTRFRQSEVDRYLASLSNKAA